MNTNEKIHFNPIIEAIKSKTSGPVHILQGYLSKGNNGKIELYLNVDMKICYEINANDIIYVSESEKLNEPSTILVKDKSNIVVRQAAVLDFVAESISTSSEILEDKVDVLALQSGGGGSGTTNCKDKYDNCVKKCENKGAFKQGCIDSCQASYRLCRGGLGGGGGVIIA